MRCELRPNTPRDTLPLADRYHIPYPAVDLDDPQARLTVREHAGAPRPPSRDGLALRAPAGRALSPTPPRRIWRAASTPGAIYEVVYRAADPPLVGLGFLAVRDTAAWLRWAPAASGNPCAGALERAYVFGVSQSGRFLRHILYLGLDEDEQGRLVFDAVMPHVAGGRRGEFNLRFGQPSLNAQEAVGSLFPFTDESRPIRHRSARRLLRAWTRAAACRRIFAINTSAEYWRGDASLIHTDVEGRARRRAAGGRARIYLFAGTQHTPGALPPPPADPNTGGRGMHPVQRRRLRAAAARRARQPRPLGAARASSRRRARSRGWPTAPRWPRESIGAALRRAFPACASPTA